MTKANEVPRIDLLERDVKLMFDWLRETRKENERLKFNRYWHKERAEALNKENIELRTELDKLAEDYEELKEKYNELKDRFDAQEQAEKDELAFYIKNQREHRKMSFNAFGRVLGVSGTTLQNYEKGKGNLDNMGELVNKIQKLKRRG